MMKARKLFLRALLLFFAFWLSAALTALFQSAQETENRGEMNAPTLPELMVEFDGVTANRMCGYARKMQTDFIRDCITPLDTTKKVSFVINPYQTSVTSLAYEIRTCDGSKVMENRKIKVLTSGDSGTLRTSVVIGSDLLLNQEYSMQITLETGVGEVYYYTRVVARSNIPVATYLRFVRNFVEKSLDYQNADELLNYIEPDNSQVVTNFSNISIKSTLDQVTWGQLRPEISIRGIPVIKDINETTASVGMDYEITATDEAGTREIYSVNEFYRMSLSSAKILLLDFHRSAKAVFTPTEASISAEGLILGVRDRSVVMRTNPGTGVTAFVQNGELWTYTPSDGKATRVFSFRRDNADFRDGRSDFGIQIIRVEENADVDFVVYGYFPRGEREGNCGVLVYHYNNDRGAIEEKVFIPFTKSADFLTRDIDRLSYVCTDGRFYLLFGDCLCQVNTQEGSYAVVESGIDGDRFAQSTTGAHAAWILTSGKNAGYIKEMEFETKATRIVKPKDGRLLRLVGFMNEDLIYGVLKDEDVLVDEVGHVQEGFRSLVIENFGGEVLKRYKVEDGQVITDVTLGDMLLEFWISKKSGDAYTHVKKDNILNNSREGGSYVQVELAGTARTGIQVRLAFAEPPTVTVPLVVRAKTKSVHDRTILLESNAAEKDYYYVYAYGKLDGIFENVADAVNQADERLGVVLNRSQQYVWERGNKKDNYTLRVEDIPDAFLQGSLDTKELEASLGENAHLLDLSGCSLDAVLYEVSAGRPVVARTGGTEGILIVGYDPYNTWLYNKKTGEVYAYAMDDSEELFGKAGNVYFSVMETWGEGR